MTENERRYNDHDMKIAERIARLETSVHETVIPLLLRIEANCKRNMCEYPPLRPSDAVPSRMPHAPEESATWIWGKAVAVVSAALAMITALGVAVIQKAPEILAAFSAFFNPPKHP